MDGIAFRNDLLGILIILGIIQGAFLAIFFLLQGEKHNMANKYFGIILMLFAVQNLDFWLAYSRYILYVPFLFDISVPFTFVMGPLFYHYVYSSVKTRSDKYLLLHYIPFFIVLIYSLFFIIQPDDFKYNVFVSSRNIDLPLKDLHLNHSFDPLGIRSRLGLIMSVQLSIYLILSYFILFKTLKNKRLSLLYPEKAVFIWLRNLLLSVTVIVIVSGIIQLLFPGGREEFLLASCITIFIYYLSFNLIRGSAFLKQSLFPDRYVKSGLTGHMKQEYKIMIERLMTEQKPFLDNLFSLKRMAKQTGIPSYQLSQILNESFNQSFFEFTRSYRIQEARKLLTDSANMNINIEDIANMVGYNSKSAFNKAFLSTTGKTPLSFKKENMR